jgi:hypothetical protein
VGSNDHDGKCTRVKNIFSAEDGLLRDGQLIELVCLRPSAIVHVRKLTRPTFCGGAAERLILHLLAWDIAGRVVHRGGRWRYKQSVDPTDRTVR